MNRNYEINTILSVIDFDYLRHQRVRIKFARTGNEFEYSEKTANFVIR